MIDDIESSFSAISGGCYPRICQTIRAKETLFEELGLGAERLPGPCEGRSAAVLPELLGQLRPERDRPLPRFRLRGVLSASHERLTDTENGPGRVSEVDVAPAKP